MSIKKLPPLPALKKPGRYQVMACGWIESLGKWGWWSRAGTTDALEQVIDIAHDDAAKCRRTFGGLMARSDGPRVYRTYDRHGWKQVGDDIVL